MLRSLWYSALVILVLTPQRDLAAQERAPSATATPGRMTLKLRRPAWFGLALECTDCDGARQQRTPSRPPVIARIWPGGAAARAKLQVGDTIFAADGKELSAPELRAKLAAAPPGETLRLLIGGTRGRYTYAIRPEPAPMEVLGGDSLPIRYRGEFAEVTVDVLTMAAPVVTRDSTGAMLIRVGEHVIRLQRP